MLIVIYSVSMSFQRTVDHYDIGIKDKINFFIIHIYFLFLCELPLYCPLQITNFWYFFFNELEGNLKGTIL